jgi:hypothetical protein
MSIYDQIERLVNTGTKATTILQRLRKGKNFSKPLAKAVGYGFAPEAIVNKLLELGGKTVRMGGTPEIRAEQEAEGMVTPEFAERAKKQLKTGVGLATGALAVTQIPKAVAGLQSIGTLGEEPEAQPQAEAAPTPAPIAPDEMMMKAEKLPTKEELEADTSELDNYVRKQLQEGKTPQSIFALLSRAKGFKDLLERAGGTSYYNRILELKKSISPSQRGSSFLDKIYERQSQESATAANSLQEAIRNAKRFM